MKESMPFASHDKMIAESAAGLFKSGRGVVAEADGEAPGGVFGQDDNSSFKDEKEFQKALADGGFWYDGSFEFGKLDGAFQTPSGKFEFVSQTLQEALFEFLALKGAQAGLAELGLTARGRATVPAAFRALCARRPGRQFSAASGTHGTVQAGDQPYRECPVFNQASRRHHPEEQRSGGGNPSAYGRRPSPARRRHGLAEPPLRGASRSACICMTVRGRTWSMRPLGWATGALDTICATRVATPWR